MEMEINASHFNLIAKINSKFVAEFNCDDDSFNARQPL